MREELRGILNVDTPPDEYDLSRTLWIARNFAKGRLELALIHQREAEKDAATDEEFMTHADDIHWYAHEEGHFVWHFCLLRLQAILEGMIVGTFLKAKNDRKLLGLKSKLDAMRAAGFRIEDSEYIALCEWADIRNVFSHWAPPSHSPGPLEESDVVEYYDLCQLLSSRWRTQQGGAT